MFLEKDIFSFYQIFFKYSKDIFDRIDKYVYIFGLEAVDFYKIIQKHG